MMTVERVKHSGAIIVSDFVGEGAGEYLLTRTYYGYTMAEAKARFKAEAKAKN
jgi:ribosomal protein S19